MSRVERKREPAETRPGLFGRYRTWAIGFLVLGCVLLMLGLWLERRGFWAQHPFMNNVASSLTSALFGLPAAIWIFSRIVDQASREREVARLSRALLTNAELLDLHVHRLLHSTSQLYVQVERMRAVAAERELERAQRRALTTLTWPDLLHWRRQVNEDQELAREILARTGRAPGLLFDDDDDERIYPVQEIRAIWDDLRSMIPAARRERLPCPRPVHVHGMEKALRQAETLDAEEVDERLMWADVAAELLSYAVDTGGNGPEDPFTLEASGPLVTYDSLDEFCRQWFGFVDYFRNGGLCTMTVTDYLNGVKSVTGVALVVTVTLRGEDPRVIRLRDAP